MRNTILLASLGIAVASTSIGCKKEDAAPPAPATPAAVPAATGTQHKYEGVTFTAPAGWKVQAEGGLMTAVGLRDGDWEPNASFRVFPNPDDKSAAELLQESMERLVRKPDFESKGIRNPIDHPGGFQYGRLAYMSKDEATSRVELYQWYALVPLADKKVLEFQASADKDTRDKYDAVFQGIVDSIKK